MQFIRFISWAILISTPFCFAAKPIVENNSKLNISLNNFLALSCDTSGNLCTAVGRDNNVDDSALLVYKSQDAGLTWGTPVQLPKAPNSHSPVGQEDATDIQCDSSGQRCFIISSAKIDTDVVLLVYKNINEQSWSMLTILPLPESDLQKEGRYIYAKLSCSYSGFSCVIAGTSRVGIKTIPLIYTTKDAGQKWSLKNSLQEPWFTYPDGISLSDVHCDNSGFLCKAVGYAMTKNSFWSSYYTSKPVVYTTEDGGANWSAPVILPSDIDDDKKVSTLNSVHCDGTGLRCMAIGFTTNLELRQNRFYSFTTMNGGVDWENKQWINPDYSSEHLTGFDCDDSMMNCTSVGQKMVLYPSGGFYLKGLVYSTINNAQTWEKNTSQPFPGFSYLTDIFCGKYEEQCIAVGIQEANHSVRADLRSYELLLKLPGTMYSPSNK